MSFFGDFAERDNLLIHSGIRELEKIRTIEHLSCCAQVEKALRRLDQRKIISLIAINDVHKTLFGDVYTWACKQREQLAKTHGARVAPAIRGQSIPPLQGLLRLPKVPFGWHGERIAATGALATRGGFGRLSYCTPFL